MLTIDGAYGEGGGQLVRNAVALSAITGEPVTINRIRASRQKPGLGAQHVAAVNAVACVCDADTRGIITGSSDLTFLPGRPKTCDTIIEVGTAGSIPLVIQAWLPVALWFGGTLQVTGGTEVHKSPTIDYLENVLVKVLINSGADISMRIIKRGYFPEGGGEVKIEVKKKKISPIDPGSQETSCGIASCSSNLPDHVADRQASSAAQSIQKAPGLNCPPYIYRQIGQSTGSSCTAWSGAKGGSALGKRGFPAEKVGEAAVAALLKELRSPGNVDLHLSDQLLVPLALFGGTYTTSALSLHAETILWLVRQFDYELNCKHGSIVEFSA